jgi:hypothetical protein
VISSDRSKKNKINWNKKQCKLMISNTIKIKIIKPEKIELLDKVILGKKS